MNDCDAGSDPVKKALKLGGRALICVMYLSRLRMLSVPVPVRRTASFRTKRFKRPVLTLQESIESRNSNEIHMLCKTSLMKWMLDQQQEVIPHALVWDVLRGFPNFKPAIIQELANADLCIQHPCFGC